MKDAKKLVEACRVNSGEKLSLKQHKTNWTAGLKKDDAGELLAAGVEQLAIHQEMLYAQDTYAVLIIFQAMDAAGKDGTIKHVMSGINPQGCQVFSFKAPSAEERDHGYLWRSFKALPERGRIGIHNRSYYEEVLVCRVHSNLLEAQQLPTECKGDGVWRDRYRQINQFERYLVENGTIPIKIFLNVSKAEQKRRFLARIERPEKNWKFSVNDANEREHWDDYMKAYEDAFRYTSTRHAPWYIVPADNKWFTRLAVAEIIRQRLKKLRLAFPDVTPARKKELQRVRLALLGKKR